jgi:hypothetical protein
LRGFASAVAAAASLALVRPHRETDELGKPALDLAA